MGENITKFFIMDILKKEENLMYVSHPRLADLVATLTGPCGTTTLFANPGSGILSEVTLILLLLQDQLFHQPEAVI